MNTFTQGIIKYRWPIIIAVLILTAFFGYQIRNVEVESDVVNALPESDPIVQKFREVGDLFGSNQIGLVIIKDENIFDGETLDDIQRITDTLTELEGVVSVTSLTNMTRFEVEGDFIEVSDLIDRSRWPRTAEEADSTRAEITGNDMVTGTLVAPNGESCIVLFYFANDADIKTVSGDVMKAIGSLNLEEEVYYAGSTFLTSYVSDIIRKDMARLIPISFVLIALILFLSFRSGRGVLLPLLSAALANVWAIGTFGLVGLNLSMVSNNVPIIILAVGSAYSIHVFNRIQQSLETNREKSINTALKLIILPVVLSALTTMVGFTSFVFGAYLTMIRDFGILAALGTFYSALLAILFVPAFMAVLPARQLARPRLSFEERNPIMKRVLLMPLYRASAAHPRRVAVIWVVLSVLSVYGITQLQRSVSVADYFRKNHPASQADRIMEDQYGGSKPVFAVFEGDIQEPEVLQTMDEFGDYMLESPYVTSTQSIADVVAMLNDKLTGENRGIPDEKSIIQQLWFFLGQQDLSQLVTEDLDRAVILAKFNNEGQSSIEAFNDYTDAFLSAHQSDAYSIELTGMPYVNTQLDRSLVRSQLTSLLFAVILVYILVSLIFRSAREGAYAAAPIIATVGILYGAMGLTGIPLNVATVLVASVAMGIGIDYSIHFLSNFNLVHRNDGDVGQAIYQAMMMSGKAILVNCIAVTAGFAVLVFSDLMPMVYFGILIALSMLGSALGALTLLPAIIVLTKGRALA